MRVSVDRERLRRTFDSAADTYEAARPDYPSQLYDDLVELADLSPAADLVEVGCGPGKATSPLASRGFSITALELGPALAETARRNLGRFTNVLVVHTSFEEWTPPDGRRYDLVYAATAWAWIDPKVKYKRTAAVLRPGGHLAIWNAVHAFPDGFDPFFTEIQTVYEEIGEKVEDWPPPPPQLVAGDADDLESSGQFDLVGTRRYVWAIDYDADRYLSLLDTFSGHIAMESAKRDHLYHEIRRRVDARPSRTIHRHWLAILSVARLRG
jgi:SAM-dependent methyltransferase